MSLLKKFWEQRSGNFAMMLGLCALPVILSAGLAVDYGRMTSERSYLQQLADGASLTIASSREKDEKKLLKMATDYLEANTSPADFAKLTISKLDTKEKGDVKLWLESSIPTYFMGLANVDKVDVGVFARALRNIGGGAEVSLVLDNTDSMNQDNKISDLKKAAGDLVDKLFEDKEANVRVALVPYGEQINVGLANRNASWLSVPDDYYKSENITTTTTTPAHWQQSTKKTSQCKTWKEAGSQQVEKDGVMVTDTWPRSCSEYYYENVGEPVWIEEKIETKTTTKVTQYTWKGCIGSRYDTADRKLLLNESKPQIPYPGFLSVPSRQYCLTEILPLTKNQATVKSAITAMITSRSGYTPQTYVPGGLMWGINTLSPAEPFSEGVAYDPRNIKPRKALVLMTDGLNTRRVNITGKANTDYLTSSSFTGDYTSATAAQRINTNTETTTLCNYAKTLNIEIFTVAFKVDDGTAKTMLQGCASNTVGTLDHYFDATDTAKLLAAFADIADRLQQVRLAE